MKKASKMRGTAPGIINLPRTIRATLDDLNGPEVTFLSLSRPPLCLRRLVPPPPNCLRQLATIIGLLMVQCNYYTSCPIAISMLQAVSPAHVARKFCKRVSVKKI